MTQAPPLTLGTAAYRRTTSVLLVVGFIAFAQLYVVQGALPAISADFGVSPATSSLALSLTTLPIAICVVPWAALSERRGRRPLLIGSLLAGSILTLASAAAPGFAALLGCRLVTGVALAALPAVAMAYVAEEVAGESLGAAMGLYIGATGTGGMAGRLVGAFLSSGGGWRWPLLVVGAVGLVGSFAVVAWLPPSRHFTPDPSSMRARFAALRGPLTDRRLLRLLVCGFVLMGTLVSFFNYLQYRLAAAPFWLGHLAVAAVFGTYAFASVGANVFGRRADRSGTRGALLTGMAVMTAGILLTLPARLPFVLVGTVVTVVGFFGAHAVASGWAAAVRPTQRGPASSLYLLAYHTGSSTVGFAAGLSFGAWGWAGEVFTGVPLLGIGMLGVLAGGRRARDGSPDATR